MARGWLDLTVGPDILGSTSKSRKRKRTLSLRDRQILYKRAKGRCEACGKKISFSAMQVGHKRAYSKGGATTLANSACLCYECNKLQGTDSLETLKKKLAGTYGKRTKKSKKKRRAKRKTANPFGITIEPFKLW